MGEKVVNKDMHFSAEELDLIEYLLKHTIEHSMSVSDKDVARYKRVLDKLPFYRTVAWHNENS